MSCNRAAEFEVVSRQGGEKALFIVEVGSIARARQLLGYLRSTPCEVRPISVGPVVVCAAWVREGEPNPFAEMEDHLRERYSLSICERGFSHSMYRVALQLARDAEAELHPLGRCCLCGAQDPFPTTIQVREGAHASEATFCGACVAAAETADPLSLARFLTASAVEVLGQWDEASWELDGRNGDTWRFRVRGAALLRPVSLETGSRV